MRTSYDNTLTILTAMCLCVICSALPSLNRFPKHRDIRKIGVKLTNITSRDGRQQRRIPVLERVRGRHYKRLLAEMQTVATAQRGKTVPKPRTAERHTEHSGMLQDAPMAVRHNTERPRLVQDTPSIIRHTERSGMVQDAPMTIRHNKHKRTFHGARTNYKIRHKKRKATHRTTNWSRVRAILREKRRQYKKRVKTTATYPTSQSQLSILIRTRNRNMNKVKAGVILKTNNKNSEKTDVQNKKRHKKKHSMLIMLYNKRRARRKFKRLRKTRRLRKKWFLSYYDNDAKKAKKSRWPYIVPCPADNPKRYYCHQGGECIYVGALDMTTCRCKPGYIGKRCEETIQSSKGTNLSMNPRVPSKTWWFLR